MPATVNNDPHVETGTGAYLNTPRPVYSNETAEPTNSVEKPGNVTYDATVDQSEGVDNVRDDRERTVYEWPAVAPEKAAKKSRK